MPSFDVVNYSLRPNKAIQRSLVFEAVRILQDCLDLSNLVYVGLGSIWFTDFQIVHKFLRVETMISMEGDEIGYRRARFNQPFKTIRVMKGYSYELLPKLLSSKKLTKHPWFIWLDYDEALDEVKIADIRRVIESAPDNSLFLVTLPVAAKAFGPPIQRPARLRRIMGSVVPDNLRAQDCRDENLSETLLALVGDFMTSAAAKISRPGGFIPAFRIAYRDSTPMITVGGILPTKGAIVPSRKAISSTGWPSIPTKPIETPPLTLREVAVFQSQLPRQRPLNRKAIRKLGFDLEVRQLRSFEQYYRYYPIFAQIST